MMNNNDNDDNHDDYNNDNNDMVMDWNRRLGYEVSFLPQNYNHMIYFTFCPRLTFFRIFKCMANFLKIIFVNKNIELDIFILKTIILIWKTLKLRFNGRLQVSFIKILPKRISGAQVRQTEDKNQRRFIRECRLH